jgi:MoaA/NifB/PqqE/SkfB family radical SAM enzyme
MNRDERILPDRQPTGNQEAVLGVGSHAKVAVHRQRIETYLKTGKIYPVSLELDLTSRCNRDCADCPSTRASANHFLDWEFVNTLLTRLEGHTRGLLLTGGEPTLSPLFDRVLALAREKGFENIALVTNGARLEDPAIYEALLTHGSTIRLSLYDFRGGKCGGGIESLGKIRWLRDSIDRKNSRLQIGVSILTDESRLEILSDQVRQVIEAGAHWIYFHPLCRGWGRGAPQMTPQGRVTDILESLKNDYEESIRLYYTPDRYRDYPLNWEHYHGAHFLMIVGADKKNYLSAELKYQPDHIIADLGDDLPENFLWEPERLERLNAYNSRTYPALGSRHRGSLYSDFIHRLKTRPDIYREFQNTRYRAEFPHIL